MDEILKRSRTSVDSWFKKLHPQLAGPFALKPVVMQECSSNRVWRRKVLLHGILEGQREKVWETVTATMLEYLQGLTTILTLSF